MKRLLIICGVCLTIINNTLAQNTRKVPAIYKIPIDLLAGEGLEEKKQADPSRSFYQKLVFNGADLAVYMVAIETGITNEFQSFPMEEFIFWMNGKAVVEPEGEDSFPVYTGDYFIQAKGFRGKWNFVDIGSPHLELALVAKNRPDSTFKSPMTKALLIDRDIVSGVVKPSNGAIYQGPELTLNILNSVKELSEKVSRERMLHVLNGVLTITESNQPEQTFYPGDFIIFKEGFKGTFQSNSLQELRVFEVYKTKS